MEYVIQPHIRLSDEVDVRYALLPGDPGRVDAVAKFLDQPEEMAHNREFRTIKGSYKGLPVLVTSTGIGGASTGIAVEELARIGVKAMIRIGSCGAVQPGIRLGDLVIASGAVRDEGASHAYIESPYPAVPDTVLLTHVIEAASQSGFPSHTGIVRSHDSFYTDQEEQIDSYWSGKGVLASDMETAALFVIGGLRGIKTASILNVVVEKEGDLEGGINEYVEEEGASKLGEEREIRAALEAIVLYHQSINR